MQDACEQCGCCYCINSGYVIKRFVFTLFSLLGASLITIAQLVCIPNHNTETEDGFFNPEFIRLNKIKTVYGDISLKKTMQPIKPLGLDIRYEFYSSGKLKNKYETYYKKNRIKDTLCVHYEYDEKGRRISSTKNDYFGFMELSWEYDPDDNIISEKYSRIDNEGNSKKNFSAGRRLIIRKENYSYITNIAGQITKIFYNSSGKEYMRKLSIYNSIGNVTEETKRLIVTNKRSKTTFKYDDFNRLSIKTEFSKMAGTDSTQLLYSYDDIGNIEEERLVQNGKQISLIQFLYNKKTMLLDAKLEKDESNGDITITRYHYDFTE